MILGQLEQQFDGNISRFVATLPAYLRGPNAKRVITNLANGGARLRTFMRTDNTHGLVMRRLVQIPDMFGSKTRTLKSRVAFPPANT
jgi:hypothetical protein